MRSYSKVTLKCLARDRDNQYLLPEQVQPCCPERSEEPAQGGCVQWTGEVRGDDGCHGALRG